MRSLLFAYVTLAIVGFPETLVSEPTGSETADVSEAETPWSLRGGVGFTLDPGTFLMAFEADYGFTEELSVGPLLQLGVSDDETILAPSANLRFAFDLTEFSEPLNRIRPFLQGGVGFAYVNEDDRRGDDDGVAFLINFGFGGDFFLTERFALGSNVLFNALPGGAAGENFFFSWQFVTAEYRF